MKHLKDLVRKARTTIKVKLLWVENPAATIKCKHCGKKTVWRYKDIYKRDGFLDDVFCVHCGGANYAPTGFMFNDFLFNNKGDERLTPGFERIF